MFLYADENDTTVYKYSFISKIGVINVDSEKR